MSPWVKYGPVRRQGVTLWLLILIYRKPFGGPADPVKNLDPIQTVCWFEWIRSGNSFSYNFSLEHLQTLRKVREQL